MAGSKTKTLNNSNQYGPILKTGRAEEYAMHIFRISRQEKEAGRKGIPVCSWGEAGIGKTELPNYLVKTYTEMFGGNIVYLPMAQIEEKAELQGLPELQTTKRLLKTINYRLIKATAKNKASVKPEDIVVEISGKKKIEYIKSEETVSSSDILNPTYPDSYFTTKGNDYVISSTGQDDKAILYYSEVEDLDGSQSIMEEVIDGELKKYVVDARTIYATPSWIPQESTHGERGLLVIDDMNRADGRIINSIMQLLQDGELLGWKLPKGWEIFCTCNPNDGKYDVTPFDGAQMSRMANFTQKFDPESWLSAWAIPTGIHPIAQNFVMSYPEAMVKGERTNPRSFDKLFRIIAPVLDKVKVTGDRMELGGKGEGGKLAKIINDYGLMNIEEDSLQIFISFLTSGYGTLPNIEEILDPEYDLDKFYSKITTGGLLQTDICAALNTRLILYLKSEGSALAGDKKILKGVKNWMMNKNLPADLRYSILDDVISTLPNIIDKDLTQMIYSRMARK